MQSMDSSTHCWKSIQRCSPTTTTANRTKVVRFVPSKFHTKRYEQFEIDTGNFNSELTCLSYNFTGKPNHFHRINNSRSWMGYSRHYHILLEWIAYLRQTGNPSLGWKLRLGYCARNKCRRIRIHTLWSKLTKYNRNREAWSNNESLRIFFRTACGERHANQIQNHVVLALMQTETGISIMLVCCQLITIERERSSNDFY